MLFCDDHDDRSVDDKISIEIRDATVSDMAKYELIGVNAAAEDCIRAAVEKLIILVDCKKLLITLFACESLGIKCRN